MALLVDESHAAIFWWSSSPEEGKTQTCVLAEVNRALAGRVHARKKAERGDEL